MLTGECSIVFRFSHMTIPPLFIVTEDALLQRFLQSNVSVYLAEGLRAGALQESVGPQFLVGEL
jgi:hypothetical protein